MTKYANIAGIAGLGLVLLGLVIYSINSIMSTLNLIVLIVGLVALIAFLVLRFKEIKTGLSSRSAKFSTNAAFMIVFVLGILIVVNIIFARFNYRFDTTAAKQFSLAEQTRKVLKNLDNEVHVMGFFKSGEEFTARELMVEYANVSPKFSYEFIDPDKKPGMAKRHGITAYGTILIDAQGKTEKIQNAREEDLTNAIIKVTRESVKKIYFTTGHGERDYEDSERSGLSFAKEALEEENYLIDRILLAEADSIPSNCSVLVVAGPKTDLFAHEREMIENYLKRGGKCLFLLDPDAPQSYADFLESYGFDIGRDIVVDASGIGQLFGAGPTIPIVSQYEDHQLTKEFAVMTFFAEARSVSKAEEVPSGITFTELAKTSARSWGETSPLAEGRIAFDEGADLKGPVPILAVAEREAEEPAAVEDKYDLGMGSVKTRLAVFGDSDFASNGYFRVQGNGDLFQNCVSWLAEEEDLISVRARDPEDRRLNLTQKQSRVILYLGVILMPLFIFATGIWVYAKRK